MLIVPADKGLLGGSGFVYFLHERDAQKVLDMHHFLPFTFGDVEVKINFGQNSYTSPSDSLLISGLPPGCTSSDIRVAFRSFGDVLRSVLIRKSFSALCVAFCIRLPAMYSQIATVTEHPKTSLLFGSRMSRQHVGSL